MNIWKLILCLSVLVYTLPACAHKKADSAAIKKALLTKEYLRYKDGFKKFEETHGHYVQTPNVRLHYLTWGQPSGKPFIWSHGTFGNACEIYSVADSLSREGYYVISIDYYGHGLTPIPTHEVSLYHVADDIKTLMDSLHIPKAVIGGFSRGGSVATAFYDAYPGSVLALVLEDGGSVAWGTNEHKQSVDSTTRKIEQQYKSRTPLPTYKSELELFEWMYERFRTKPDFNRIVYAFFYRIKPCGDGRFCLNPGVDDLIFERTAEQLLTGVFRPFAASLFGASSQMLYPKIIYRNLDVPMLIFDPTNSEDWFDFEKANEELRLAHPALVVHKVYPNTGHLVKNEKLTEFVNDLRDFLQRVK